MKNLLKHKKIIIFLLILIAAVTVILGLNKNKKAPVISANVIALETKTIEQIISVKSPLEGIEKAEVVSPLNYEIIDIRVKEGDLVKKDQILAVLDSEELQKEIASAESQIELTDLEQQDKLRALQTEYEKAVMQLAELEKSYNQNKKLLEDDIITEETFAKIESSYKETKKTVEGYNAVNGKIVLNPSEVKRIAILKEDLKQKKENLDKIYIKSPINGTVTRVNVNLGRYAKDTVNEKSMFVVENLEKLQMKVSVSEFDVGKIKINQEAEIYADILEGKTVKGVVSRISPTAEQKDNNSMERVIPVLIEVTDKPDNLIAGVIATAKIKVDKAENIFAVPAGAIIQEEDSKFKIYTLNSDNSLKSIPVKIGLETDLETEIQGSDLTEGMKIVINPDNTFTDGTVVTPNESEAK